MNEDFWRMPPSSTRENKRKLISLGIDPKFISGRISHGNQWQKFKHRASDWWKTVICRHEYEMIGIEIWCLKCDHRKRKYKHNEIRTQPSLQILFKRERFLASLARSRATRQQTGLRSRDLAWSLRVRTVENSLA